MSPTTANPHAPLYVLGIDAGATKTVCVAADGEGRIIAESRGGSANLQTVGELGVEKTLHDVMQRALDGLDILPAAICVGMAGVDRPPDHEAVDAILRRIGSKARVLVVNDALIALTAGAGVEAGIVVIAGTGSIVYGHDGRGAAARAGGWGHVLSDEGSGYWIGQRALRAMVRSLDGRGPATMLTRRLTERFGVGSPHELVRRIYDADGRRAVAELVEVVEAARRDGDQIAEGVLEDAASELALAARSVAEQLDMTRVAFPFVLAGGVFKASTWLAEELGRRLPVEAAASSRVVPLSDEPAVGAVRLALRAAHGDITVPRYVR